MVAIKASYEPNNKNHPVIKITWNNTQITIKPITKIQTNVRLVKKVAYNYWGDIEEKWIVGRK